MYDHWSGAFNVLTIHQLLPFDIKIASQLLVISVITNHGYLQLQRSSKNSVWNIRFAHPSYTTTDTIVLRGTTVLPRHRGTIFLRYQYRRLYGTI